MLNVEGISEKFCNVNYSDKTLQKWYFQAKLNWFEIKYISIAPVLKCGTENYTIFKFSFIPLRLLQSNEIRKFSPGQVLF